MIILNKNMVKVYKKTFYIYNVVSGKAIHGKTNKKAKYMDVYSSTGRPFSSCGWGIF